MTMTATARAFGVARSLAMYYGIPFRARRLRRFYSEFVHAGALCFDVGAHVGNRVGCWRRLGARVVAIEPQPDFVRILRWLYGDDNGVEDKLVYVIPALAILVAAVGIAFALTRWRRDRGGPDSTRPHHARDHRIGTRHLCVGSATLL